MTRQGKLCLLPLIRTRLPYIMYTPTKVVEETKECSNSEKHLGELPCDRGHTLFVQQYPVREHLGKTKIELTEMLP